MQRVLIAEDSPDDVKLLLTFLKDFELDIEVANDGNEAWQKFCDGHSFDLLILDINMPVMDGFALLKKIRQKELKLNNLKKPIHFETLEEYKIYENAALTKANEQLQRMKILVTSGNSDKETILALKEARVGNFIMKPLDREDLTARVAKLLVAQVRSE